jgi:prolyl oligopeptidase
MIQSRSTVLLLLLCAAVTAACSTRAATPAAEPASGGPADDQRSLIPRDADVLPDDVGYLWLEDIGSDTVRRWADARTSHTRAYFTALPVHDSLITELQATRAAGRLVLQPGFVFPAMRTGPHANRMSAGVWMRQPWERFERGGSEWLRVLDLDSLSAALDVGVDIASVECLPPAHDRCLLLLSRGGGSRLFDLREFDVPTRSFVAGGFELSPAQTSASWRDSSSVYIATHPVGRAQRALIWRRGEELEGSDILFHADPPDGWGAPRLRGDQGVTLERRGERLLLRHIRHQYDIEYYLVRGDQPVRLPVPSDVREILFVNGQLVVQLRSAWQPAGESFPAGSLIGIDLAAFLDGSGEFALIMASGEDVVVDEIWSTRSLVLVRALADMKVRLFELSHTGGAWASRRIEVPEEGTVQVRNTDPEFDRYYFTHEDFLRPRTVLVRRESGAVEVGGLMRPAFAAEPYTVERWHATSADGTRVPYFVVRATAMEMDGRNPVIIKAYGGNGISMLPEYLSLFGPTWLNRGGVYVLANIRGGNEYGVDWHYGVRRENRQRAFDDLQAVAADLVERGITSPGMIGSHGASNGGLLVGISFIQRPDLFGAVWANNGVLELHRCSQLSGVPPVGERGDGQDPRDWAYMRHYSPFHTLGPGESYPAVLLTANRADDIVHPCHSRKFSARMEDFGYSDVFYHEAEEGGHGGGYGEPEQATIIGFFLRYLHPDHAGSGVRD